LPYQDKWPHMIFENFDAEKSSKKFFSSFVQKSQKD
jgi:hypothetical protein